MAELFMENAAAPAYVLFLKDKQFQLFKLIHNIIIS